MTAALQNTLLLLVSRAWARRPSLHNRIRFDDALRDGSRYL
jgi:hypothetical protein